MSGFSNPTETVDNKSIKETLEILKAGKSDKKEWHNKWWGKVMTGVIVGILILLIGLVVNK